MSCEDCSLHKNCKSPLVKGRGSRPEKTKYMIIQDCPTNYDDICDRVLTGDTQKKMSYFLEVSGIDISEVYFTSAIKCFSKDLNKIKNEHKDQCEKYLLREIIDHKPTMIITMGKVANHMVNDHNSVREYRGHFEKYEMDYDFKTPTGFKVKTLKAYCMPTWGLKQSLMMWEYNLDILADFKKTRIALEKRKIPRTKLPKVNTILTVGGLKDFVEKYREVEYATTDFETTGFDFWRHDIINAGYCSGDFDADIIYTLRYKKKHVGKHWTKKDLERAKEINSFLKHNTKKCFKALETVNNFDHLNLILHNGKFDSKFAKYNNIPYKNFYFDTMRASPLIEENRGHSLNICMERHGINFGPYDTELYIYTNKDEKKKKSYQHVPPPLLEKYLGIDVWGDWLLYEKTVAALKKEKMTKHFFDVCMNTTRNVENIEYIGVKYDREALVEAGDLIDEMQKKTKKRIDKITGDPKFNPNSDKQVLEIMHDKNYPFSKLKIKKTPTGRYSVATEQLEKFINLKSKKFSVFPKLIITNSKLSKLKGTYLTGNNDSDGDIGGFLKYLDPNDFIHASFNLHSPKTSRMSVNSPSLQVFPRPVKGLPNTRSFITVPDFKDDWVMFEADFRALEIKYGCSLSKDKIMFDQIINGTDMHCSNAVKIGRALDSIPKWITYEHMLVANDKVDDLKDKSILKELTKDIEKYKHIDFKEIRSGAKTLAFGIAYGQEAETFSKDFKISLEKAEDMIDAYFAKDNYFETKIWRDKIISEMNAKGFLTLPSGRKRRFLGATEWLQNSYAQGVWSTGFIQGSIERQALNYPVQGGSHEVFEAGINRLVERFKKEGLRAYLNLLIHDGIVGPCLRSEMELVRKCITEEMTHTLNKGTDFEMVLDLDIDFYERNWYGEKIK